MIHNAHCESIIIIILTIILDFFHEGILYTVFHLSSTSTFIFTYFKNSITIKERFLGLIKISQIIMLPLSICKGVAQR